MHRIHIDIGGIGSKAPSNTWASLKTMSETTLCDYEKLRAQNIERNNARLRALGLISTREEAHSNALAWRRPITQEPDSDSDSSTTTDDDGEYKPTLERKRSRQQPSNEDQIPMRKSRRLKGEDPDGITTLLPVEEGPEFRSEEQKERHSRVQECRAIRLKRARELAETYGTESSKKNPTASYEHCLMRVRTMNEKGLQNRVKAIERAAGKHCVIKMGKQNQRKTIAWFDDSSAVRDSNSECRCLLDAYNAGDITAIFKSCLQDEGLWDLAELAGKALERLKGLAVIPDNS